MIESIRTVSAAIDIEIIRGYICDAAAGSLSARNAAAVVLQRFSGATPERIVGAAIDLLREVGKIHAEAVEQLTIDIDILQDEIADLEIELEALRAKRAKPRVTP